ncbi:PREDICTED: putative uncharacterized protein FLJ37770 [Cyphomyrmex costatus]|uniref:putative uncharacterized protein FLJ37770 n=1 Tax=Cyphomyrmex costatus TaxID=456900 RepID=UPI0008522786|nr:PREDICTED: putative uncharacterized protein FLJ37770 [Cyphomyrmex costatus]
MLQENVYKWYEDFKEDRDRVENLERSGRPSMSIDEQHIKKIKELVLENRRLTIRELVDMVGISIGSVQKILKDHLVWFLHHDNAPSHAALFFLT